MKTELSVSWVVVRTVYNPAPKSAPVAVFSDEEDARKWVAEKTQIKGKNEYSIAKVVTEVPSRGFLQKLGVVR